MTEERIEAIQTQWSLIRNAHLTGRPESAGEARRLLVLRYAPAIRRYVGGIVRNDDQADELSQEVLVRLLRGDFGGADPGRGRFRDFMKTAIRNIVRSSWQKSSQRKTVDVDMELIGSEDNAASESEWTRVWRTSVLDNTWNRLLTEDGGKPGPGYVALKLRAEFPDANSDELAEKMSVRTGTAIRPDNGRQILKRARNRFASHLLDEVRGGLDSETDDRLQEELAALGLLEFVRDFLPDAEK